MAVGNEHKFYGHPKFYELTQAEIELHSQKNRDYAQGGNPLGNFVRVANILAQYPGLDLSNPSLIAIIYALKQLDAVLWMMAQGYEGAVEGIDRRLTDIHVYIKLARILHEEGKQHGNSDTVHPV